MAAVAGLPDSVLQDALARLTEAELVFLRGTPPNAIYTFKHALIQDTAYSTMLRGGASSCIPPSRWCWKNDFPMW